MFLAAIYPLSEKSALNLSGKVNTNNVTYYENEHDYMVNAGCPPPKSTAGTAGADGDGVEEEKAGSDGGAMEVNVEQQTEGGLAAPEIAYDLYQAFWRLQVNYYF